MSVKVRVADDVSIIDCTGEVDLNTTPEMHDVLESEMHKNTPAVLINLSGVTYMDSSGLATLVEGLQLSRETKTRFALFSLSSVARAVLEMARLDRIFIIFQDEKEALEKIWDTSPFSGP